MAGTPPPEPGERPTAQGRAARELAQPPSLRYRPTPAGDAPAGRTRATLTGPLARAVVVAIVGAAAILVLGGLLNSTVGLLFLSGATGGTIGLVLVRAAVPADGGPGALTRAGVTVIAGALAVGAVALANVGLGVVARTEGGLLGLANYLIETFGLLVFLEPVVAVLGAAWGAATGPVADR